MTRLRLRDESNECLTLSGLISRVKTSTARLISLSTLGLTVILDWYKSIKPFSWLFCCQKLLRADTISQSSGLKPCALNTKSGSLACSSVICIFVDDVVLPSLLMTISVPRFTSLTLFVFFFNLSYLLLVCPVDRYRETVRLLKLTPNSSNNF